MNCHSLERTIKLRVLQALAMVHYHRCELFQIENRIFKLKIELNDIELIDIELVDSE